MSIISTNSQSNEPMEVSIRLTLSGYEVWGVKCGVGVKCVCGCGVSEGTYWR